MAKSDGYHWGILGNRWRFYEPLLLFPTSSILMEVLTFIHVYLIAAFLAIREAWFDRRHKINKLKSELFSFRMWNLKTKNRRKILVVGANGTIGAQIISIIRRFSDFECHAAIHHSYAIMQDLQNDERTIIYDADLTNHEQLLLLANQLKSNRFDVAIFAAGIMLSPESRTSDGVEMHNAVNVIGQAMLYELLQNECKRAIFLSSATTRVACYSTDTNFLSVYAGPYQAYASSKLNLTVYVNEVAKRRDVIAVSLHPGTVPGGLYRHANQLVRFLNATLLPMVMRSPEMAAVLVLHTIFRDDVQCGAYYEDTETVNVPGWVPEEERSRIYEGIHRRIELWMEK